MYSKIPPFDNYADKHLHYLLSILVKDKPKDYIKYLIQFSELLLVKRTKVLGTQFLNEIRKENNDIVLIIKGHLYLELFINEILRHNLENFERLEKENIFNTFYKKVVFLESQHLIDSIESKHILTINSLRNKFAHNAYHNLADFDINKFEFIQIHFPDKFNVKSKKNKTVLNKLVIKLIFQWLIFRMPDKNSFLHLLDVERN